MTAVDGVLLLHGFTGGPEAFDVVLEGVPLGAPVLRPALLGHAPGVVDADTFEGEVRRLADLVSERGWRRVLLCGYSLGGRLALGLLAWHRARFARAVVIGAHPGLEDPAERAARMEADARWATMLTGEGIHAFVRAWEAQPLFATQRRLAPHVQHAQRARRLEHDPHGLARALHALGLGRMPPLWGDLAAMPVPLTLLVGGEDAKFTQLARRLAGRIGAAARVQTVPGVGHNVLLERPEAVRATLEAA
jgi:2-succinyl-6-hydroxy-2,4-cyclohexadiene-1-carboxylate synthase